MTISEAVQSDRMPASPGVSIIIPAYKVAPFMRETLDSVFAQTFTDFEVIVINDGSPDTLQLEEVLEDYRDKIIYLKQANQGAGAARNAGLRVARGEFVAFLDGDDVWLPNFLSEQVRLIQSDGDYDLVYADALNFGEGVPGNRTSMQTNPSHGKVTFERLLCGECNVITSTVLARRQPIMLVGCFDESIVNSQDFDLWLRLSKDANARITYQQEVLIRRRIYQGSLASDPVKSLQGELRVLEKTSTRNDLTAAERAALERVIPLRKATADVIRGKQLLVSGDFDSAVSAFRSAQEYLHSWKLRLVLAGMRTAPQLLRHWCKIRLT